MEYILAIDIGTSNTKAAAYAVDGRILAHVNESYGFLAKEEGRHEIDPDALLQAVITVSKQVSDQCSSHKLLAVSFSAAMHGIMAVDENGTPLTKMITWADLRSHHYADALKRSESGSLIYERTGTPIHAMSPLSKLIWMKESMPDVFRSAHKFISIKEYIFFRFFSQYLIDHSIASATGLFDIYSLDWNAAALSAAGIQADKLSTPVPGTHIVTGLRSAYATALGVDVQVPFVLGASDGCLAQIGSNATDAGDVSLTIGTSGAVRVLADRPLHDRKQRIFNYVLADGLYVSGGPVNNGGNVVQWFTRNILNQTVTGTDELGTLIAETAKIAPGSDGLVFLPYIYGERAPVWDADARGMYYGINGSHTHLHFLRATLEGIAFALAGILNTLAEVSGAVKNVYAGGGFTRSPAWVQIMADVLGRKLTVQDAEDSSTSGAAILALRALGRISKLDEADGFFSVSETYLPDMKNHTLYSSNFNIYSQLYDLLQNIKK